AVARLAVNEVRQWVQNLMKNAVLTQREADIARDLLPEIESRLAFLEEVGLNYLTLDRGAPTLSGGEAQRIRLAAQLGSNLQGVCYVLDEPTIGLHARDNAILLNALHKLGEMGNTLVVVEHDEDTIRRADHIIDIGPSAGKRGGRVVAQGSVADLSANPESVTGRYLLHAMKHRLQARRPMVITDAAETGSDPDSGLKLPRSANRKSKSGSDPISAEPTPTQTPELNWIEVKNAKLHNLQNLNAKVPLQRLVVITGVSGSGKSTFARDVLLTNVAEAVKLRSTFVGRQAWDNDGERPTWVGCDKLLGTEPVDRVLEVDQTPIGKTPRSCPATYIGFWDTVRKL
ncbi:MAG: excinuclease ABC subunit A, partial [Hydrogenophaga sp.]